MNSICVLSCVGLLLAAAAASYPEPCVSPPLMTGGISMVSDGGFSLAGTLTYDAYGNKIRVRTVGVAGNGSFSMDQLFLYNEGVYFDIDWFWRTCEKKQLYTDFIPLRIAKDARPVGQAILGSSSSYGMGVLINNWEGNFAFNGTYFTTFSEIGCIPMTYSGFSPAFGSTFISTYNWVLGITDPTNLLIPEICYKAKLERSATPESFFSALKSMAMKAASSD
ncbi:unnamed protein product [Ophioblennius macclurei]